MRGLFKASMILLLVVKLFANSYIYVEEGDKLPLKNQGVTLFSGDPVTVLSEGKKRVKVTVDGYIDKNDKTKLYATTNHKLVLAIVNDVKKIKIDGNKGVLVVKLSKEFLTDDMEEAWAQNSDFFYDKCTKCHHAKIVENHTMQEWEVLYGSMKPKAKTTKSQDELILRFLRAFSKDGILRESD